MAGPLNSDGIIMARAARRVGVCLRSELIDAGITPKAIECRRGSGMLQVLGRGVYLVDGLSDDRTPLYRAQALLPSGILGAETAGAIGGLAVDPAAIERGVDVLIGTRLNRRVTGVRLLRRRLMPADCDVTEVDGLHLTRPARTIIDLSAVVGPARLAHVVERAIADGLVSVGELVACFDSVARQGVNGIGKLRPVLADYVDREPVSESALERATARMLGEYGIDGFIGQYRPPWFDGRRGVVDFAHPELRIVLEADGLRWHTRRGDRINDSRRDRVAAANGWAVIRVTWAEVTERPSRLADEIRAVMSSRRTELRAA